MKTFYAILCIAIASLTQLQAQAPQGFNYQATVRNSSGDLIVKTNVYFKFNVIQGSNTAVPIFTETHYVPTDDLGQVNLIIGQGTANTGTFSELDWSLGSYYLGIELNTGSGYVAMGTTQLLSVPYALYAENSGNSTPTTPNLEAVLAENNSANNQQIKDLQDPTEAQDAVTKAYIDALVAEAIAGLQSQIDDLDTDNSSGSVTDQDGNTYDYLTYGDQVWTVDNAQMVTYRDGTPIPQVTDQTEWSNLSTGAWAYYDNDPTKPRLYNWYAVMGIHDTDPNTPNKEFAPEGWHVPSDAEWTTFEEHLIANGYNYDESTTENKIAKAMASTTGWNSSTDLGAVGNDQSLNNDSEFNAVPEGYRNGITSNFQEYGSLAIFWTSSENEDDVDAWRRNLDWDSSALIKYGHWKTSGISVRFVRDGEVNSNAQVNPIDDVYVCPGDDAYAEVSTTNTQGTTQYYWTNDNDSTGIPLSGIGYQGVLGHGVFNTTSEPQVSTITVTPELTFQGQTTTGPPETFTVTVNPSGQVNQVEDITVNSGEIVNEIIFSTSNSSDATSYTWTNNTSSLGLPANGSGNIPSFTAINTTTTPIVGTITVTPDFTNGGLICDGPSISFTVTVNPAAGGTGTVTDQDGNTYDYLTYGDQVWTVDNAEMVTYRDGTPIPEVTDPTQWSNLTTGAWSYYNNDPTKPRLYNWYAVMGIHDTDPNTPNKEFAPEGWHVPSDAEWTTLENYLIANGYNYDGTTTENKIAKAMASTTGWISSTEPGVPGNNQSLNNSSGFNAFPEGFRNNVGSFYYEGNDAFFWSSTEFNTNSAWFRDLYYGVSFLSRSNNFKQYGFSVRFVRD
jgi:uncharacterized protein (TIGR02145 family)